MNHSRLTVYLFFRCTVFPDSLPSIVKRLIVQKAMQVKPGSYDPSSRLVAITCRDCSIASIPSNAFVQFPNLREIDFSRGQIFHVSPEAFNGLVNLKKIDLSFNRLTDLHSDAFVLVKTTLEVLEINNNKIDKIPLSDVRNLNQVQHLSTFEFHSNSIFCSCELFYVHQLIEFKHISSKYNEYYCYQKPRFLTFGEENEFLESNCPSHYEPMITNISAIDCSSIQVSFSYEPFVHNFSDRIIYVVEIELPKSRTERHEIHQKHFSIPNLLPRTTYQISIAAIQEGMSVDKSKPRKFMITQYINAQTGSIQECQSYTSAALELQNPKRSNLIYHTGIISAVAISATVFIAMIAAIGVYFCRSSRATLLPASIFKPRTCFNEFNIAASQQPALTNMSFHDTALHSDGDKFCSSDALRRHILANPCIKVVKHENIAFNRVLKSGKFGTMYSAEAFMIKPEEYHSNVTVIEFAQRSLYERTGSKLINFCRLSHPNILGILGIQETIGPIALVLEYMHEYLDLRMFLKRMQARSQIPAHEDPVQVLSLAVAQVISGLSYLSQNGFVHGDISARSCVVTGNFGIKITFTGAQIDFYPEDYLRTGNRCLPLRWMSWEAIQFGSYSLQSDIWSFGVLIYEIFTYGDKPFKNLSDMEVACHITEKRGSLASFTKPLICPDEIWKIAEDCWRHVPNERITACGIENRLLQEVWNIYITENDDMTQSEFEQTFKSEMVRRMSESRINLGQSEFSSSDEETLYGETSQIYTGLEETTTHAEVILPALVVTALEDTNYLDPKLFNLETSA